MSSPEASRRRPAPEDSALPCRVGPWTAPPTGGSPGGAARRPEARERRCAPRIPGWPSPSERPEAAGGSPPVPKARPRALRRSRLGGGISSGCRGVPVGAGAGDVEDEAVALAGGGDGDVAQDCAAGDLPGGHVRSAGSERRALGELLARAEPHRKRDVAVGALAVVEGDRAGGVVADAHHAVVQRVGRVDPLPGPGIRTLHRLSAEHPGSGGGRAVRRTSPTRWPLLSHGRRSWPNSPGGPSRGDALRLARRGSRCAAAASNSGRLRRR